MIKRIIRKAVNGLGFELTRRQPRPPTPFDVQKAMMRADDELVIFDVGAFAGQTSIVYRQLFPQAMIYAFEPTPGAIDSLRSRFVSREKHEFHAVALSDRQGEMEFHLNTSGATNSLLATDAEAPSYARKLVTA